MLTLSTGFGETTTIQLEDGTEVWINANSSIRYPAHFSSASARRVEMQGEAYFKVKRAPRAASRVRSTYGPHGCGSDRHRV